VPAAANSIVGCLATPANVVIANLILSSKEIALLPSRLARLGRTALFSLLAVLLLLATGKAQERQKIEVVAKVPHNDQIESVAFSPDGARILSAGADQTIKLWDVATSQLLRTFIGHTDYVQAVAFSPDGGRILSGGFEGTLILWDAATGKALQTYHSKLDPGESNTITSVAFSPDGSKILAASQNKTLKVWDVSTGALLRTLKGPGYISSAAFSADGSTILSGDGYIDNEDCQIKAKGSKAHFMRLWDAVKGTEIRTFQGDYHHFTSVAFSPDGSQMLSGESTGCINGNKLDLVKLWDTKTGKLIRRALRGKHICGLLTRRNKDPHRKRRTCSQILGRSDWKT
jgi:WD40 repeat protein